MEDYCMNDILNNGKLTVGILICMAIVGYVFYNKPFYKKLKEDPTQDFDEPQAIASLGVLGTFIGIAYSLLQFNSGDIEASVPALLDGMRTAFATSVVGMIWSMSMKYYQNKKEKEYYQQQTKIDNDATIGTLIAYLQNKDNLDKEKEQILSDYRTKMLDATQEINKSLVGDKDSSVITQVQLIKSKVSDGFEKSLDQSKQQHDAMIKEFRDFAQTMAENNSKAFIEALNQTIHDFNEKIQEQFGENFKQLNIAVGKLLQWQEEYKNTIVEVTNNQKVIFEGIEAAKKSLESMAGHGDSIQKSAKELGNILVTLDKYQIELQQGLAYLKEIGEQAKAMVPQVKVLSDETQNGIKEISETAIGRVKEVHEASDKELVATTKAIRERFNEVYVEMVNSGRQVEATTKEALEAVKSSSASIENLSSKSVQTVNKQMEDISNALNQTVGEMLKVVSKYQDDMSNASSKAIETIKGASDKLQNSALQVTQKVSDNLVKISEENNEELKKQQKNMADNFEDAMSKAIYAMGNEMAKISKKFASDYTPLANKLAEIVRIAEQSQRRRG